MSFINLQKKKKKKKLFQLTIAKSCSTIQKNVMTGDIKLQVCSIKFWNKTIFCQNLLLFYSKYLIWRFSPTVAGFGVFQKILAIFSWNFRNFIESCKVATDKFPHQSKAPYQMDNLRKIQSKCSRWCKRPFHCNCRAW